MSKDYDHFESYEWLGLFWIPEEKVEFPGKLIYSPEDGIALEFMCSFEMKFNKVSHLHGALATGEICTLLGNVNSENFGISFGRYAIYKGKPKFNALILGTHSSPTDLFAGFTLDLTNFQEFCHPQGFKEWATFSMEPLYQGIVNNIDISIRNTGKFGYLKDNLENLIHCENKEVVQKITNAIFEISQEYDDVEILQRKDIGWELWAECIKGMDYAKINENILLLEYLISLLIFSPVRRTIVSILINSSIAEGKVERRSILTSLFDLSKYKVQVLKREISNSHQAITPNTIGNFSKVISNWFEGDQAYQAFGSQIANRFGRFHEHELKASIILHLVQLEFISIELGNENRKYDFTLEKYDFCHIRQSMATIFQIKDISMLGVLLSKLRGEIAHIKKSKKILPKIGVIGLMKINRYLEIIIASHIYKKLEIDQANVEKFQAKELPPLP